jgi:beta-glucosidase/6-phospho-beta-glucosidase/beta-galactosidase
MNIIQIEKSNDGIKLSLYESDLTLIESNSFVDIYTTNFYMQTLARKHNMKKVLFVIHNKNKNSVEMTLAEEENAFFIT